MSKTITVTADLSFNTGLAPISDTVRFEVDEKTLELILDSADFVREKRVESVRIEAPDYEIDVPFEIEVALLVVTNNYVYFYCQDDGQNQVESEGMSINKITELWSE